MEFEADAITLFPIYDVEFIAMPPSQLELIDSILLMLRPGRGVVAKMLKESDGSEIGDWNFIGRGDDEYINPYFVNQNRKDSTLLFYDVTLKNFKGYKWSKENDSLTLKRSFKEAYDGLLTTHLTGLDNGYVVAQAIQESNKLYFLMDKNRTVVERFCNPIKDKLSNSSLIRLTSVFDSYGNKFVAATMTMGYIGCYEVMPDGNMVKHWEYLMSEPIYEITDQFDFKEDNAYGFYDVKMTKDYIFCAYSGKTDGEANYPMPESVLVFDHAGNPIKEIVLGGGQFVRIAVTPDNRYLYASEVESIVKYDLSSALPQ